MGDQEPEGSEESADTYKGPDLSYEYTQDLSYEYTRSQCLKLWHTDILEGKPPDDIIKGAIECYLCYCRAHRGAVEVKPDLYNYILLQAVKASYIPLIQRLAERGHIPQKTDLQYVFHKACYFGNALVIKELVCVGYDPYTIGMCADGTPQLALTAAIAHDRIQVLEAILPGCKTNKGSQSRTPLHFACDEGAFKCTSYLLDKFPEHINMVDCAGYTPLMLAVRHNLRLVQLLLDHGATVNQQTTEGRNALHLLFRQTVGNTRKSFLPEESTSIAKVLLEKGINVNSHNRYLDTPLSVLCSQIRTELHQMMDTVFPYSLDTHHRIIRDSALLLLSHGARLDQDIGAQPLSVVLNALCATLDATSSLSQKEPVFKRRKLTLTFSIELLEELLKHGAHPDSLNMYLLTPLTQMFAYLHGCHYLSEDNWTLVWPDIRRVFLLLLQYGARQCDLREAFWHPLLKRDVIHMVLNSMIQRTYYKQLASVCNAVQNQNSKDENIKEHHNWALQLASSVPSLSQITRAVLYEILGNRLLTDVHKLQLPSLMIDNILTFEKL